MKRLHIFLFVTFLCIMITACGNRSNENRMSANVITNGDNSIQTDVVIDDENVEMVLSAERYLGRDYELTIAQLGYYGFSNIHTNVIEDLTSSDLAKDGTIEEISINGITDFKSGSEFPKDADVLITYHAIKRLNPPLSSAEIQNVDYADIAKMFEVAGFTNVKTEEVFDLDPDDFNGEFENEVSIGDKSSFSTEDVCLFDTEILIICHRCFEKYTLQVHLDCIANWFFSKYDLDIFLDGKKQVTLEHGTKADYEFRVKAGEHIIKFAEKGSPSITGEVALGDVASDIEMSFRLLCCSDKVDVETIYIDRKNELSADEVKLVSSSSEYKYKNYRDIVEELEDIGFTNIKTEVVYDILFGIFTLDGESDKITINGVSSFKRGEVFPKDAEVIVTYHTFIDNEPSAEGSEIPVTQIPEPTGVTVSFPVETAAKVSIVAMTNCYALDVFSSDGNYYDPSKFHAYGEDSEYMLSIYSDGTWTAKGENIWHVDELILKQNNRDFYLRVFLDITYDGTNYVVSNVKANHQRLIYLYDADPSKLNYEEYEPTENNQFLIVPPDLIGNAS